MTEREVDNPETMWELLSPEIQSALQKAVEDKRGKPRTERSRLIRSCPRCGRNDTTDCDRAKGIEDVTIGLCISCGYLWCLECEAALLTSILCGHWQVCAHCGEKKNASGLCGTSALRCRHIQIWLSKNHPTV